MIPTDGPPEPATTVAQDLAAGTRKAMLTDAVDARYVAPGYLAFLRRGTLFAVRFTRSASRSAARRSRCSTRWRRP